MELPPLQRLIFQLKFNLWEKIYNIFYSQAYWNLASWTMDAFFMFNTMYLYKYILFLLQLTMTRLWILSKPSPTVIFHVRIQFVRKQYMVSFESDCTHTWWNLQVLVLGSLYCVSVLIVHCSWCLHLQLLEETIVGGPFFVASSGSTMA
jgi:hypothetical protein